MNIKVSDIFNDFKELNIREEISKTFGRRIKLMICSDLLKEFVKNKELKQDDCLFQISPSVTNKYLKNNKKQKSRLNKAILDKCWNKIETYIKYKAIKAKKVWFKIAANYTSLECADCGHIHPDNRKRQEVFHCQNCGHLENADQNAACVIKKRAIKLIYSGTELSSKGVLLDIGHGASNKTQKKQRPLLHYNWGGCQRYWRLSRSPVLR